MIVVKLRLRNLGIYETMNAKWKIDNVQPVREGKGKGKGKWCVRNK